MEINREVKVHLHSFSVSAVDRGEYSVSDFQPLYPQHNGSRNPLNMRLG